MAIFSNDVADKVLRVLQSANRLDYTKLTNARSAGSGASSDVLERMLRSGDIDEDLVHTVLSRAYALRRCTLEAKEIDVRALPLIPLNFIDQHRAIPFGIDQRFLQVGIVDPASATLASQLKSVSNFNIEFQLITLSNFESLRGHERVKAVLDSAEKNHKQQNRASSRSRRSRFPLEDDELVPEFCDHILHTALETGTSDIHIEPFRDIARVRFRIDGRLIVREEYSDYLLRHYLGVVTRFKIMADCDISEKRLPQDGGITIPWKAKTWNFASCPAGKEWRAHCDADFEGRSVAVTRPDRAVHRQL
jgi:type IV pilus assembly protein PilB